MGAGEHRLASQMENAIFPANGKSCLIPSLGGHLEAWGTTVPTDGETGYAKGCRFTHTDGTGVTDLLYVNIGDGTSCNFNAVAVAAD